MELVELVQKVTLVWFQLHFSHKISFSPGLDKRDEVELIRHSLDTLFVELVSFCPLVLAFAAFAPTAAFCKNAVKKIVVVIVLVFSSLPPVPEKVLSEGILRVVRRISVVPGDRVEGLK